MFLPVEKVRFKARFEIFDNDFGGKSAFSKGLGVVFNDEKASKKRMNQK